MAGLIANALTPPPNNQQVYGAETSTVDPTLRTVDAGKETVAGQLTSILSSGSPVLERAKAGAMQTANARGLLNSSMAAGAGEAAAIDSALPIATADANVYGTVAGTNQATTNAAKSFNAGATNTSNLQTAQAANTGGFQEQAGQIQTGLQELKGTQSEALANIEAKYKNVMQTSASAAATFSQTSKAITDILNDPNTSVAQKQNAVDNQTSLLQSAMAVIGGVAQIDLSGLLNFSGSAA